MNYNTPVHRRRFLLFWATATIAFGADLGTQDLAGKPVDPFAPSANVRVFIFVRTDCPVSNRYARN